MALRDKLRERVEPYLEEGEQVEQVFLGQTGPNPMWILLTYLVFFKMKYRIFAVTDRALHVFDASMWSPAKPRALIATLPRERLDSPKGLWAKMMIGGERYWVHKRFHKDIAASNEAM